MERFPSSRGQWMPYPAGESSAVNRCSSVAGPSRGEHSSQGIWTCRLGNTMISASRVGVILFAVIGSSAFTARASKDSHPPPHENDRRQPNSFSTSTLASRDSENKKLAAPRCMRSLHRWPRLAASFRADEAGGGDLGAFFQADHAHALRGPARLANLAGIQARTLSLLRHHND